MLAYFGVYILLPVSEQRSCGTLSLSVSFHAPKKTGQCINADALILAAQTA
jgi:acyl-coenzyme A thioesterase PaaI-like protein